jgi:hypothetical protein
MCEIDRGKMYLLVSPIDARTRVRVAYARRYKLRWFQAAGGATPVVYVSRGISRTTGIACSGEFNSSATVQRNARSSNQAAPPVCWSGCVQ